MKPATPTTQAPQLPQPQRGFPAALKQEWKHLYLWRQPQTPASLALSRSSNFSPKSSFTMGQHGLWNFQSSFIMGAAPSPSRPQPPEWAFKQNKVANRVSVLLPMHFLILQWAYWCCKVGSLCKLQKQSLVSLYRSKWNIDRSETYVLWMAMAFPRTENQSNAQENSIVRCRNLRLDLNLIWIYYMYIYIYMYVCVFMYIYI